MAAGAVPYVRRAYDDRQHTQSLASMLRWRGEQAANAAIREGDASAQFSNTIGNIIGQTAQTISRIPEQRRAEEAAEAARLMREEQVRQVGQRRALEDVVRMTANLPPEQQIRELRAAGFADEATKRQREADDELTRGLQRQRTQYELAGQKLDQARTIFETIQSAPEADRPALYRQEAAGVRELVGPELGKHIRDEYDPRFMETAITWGMTASEKLAARRAGIEAINRETKDADERDKNATEGLIRYLPTVESQEELDQALRVAKARGAKDDTLATFPTTFSPEAMAKVGERGLTAEQRERRRETQTDSEYLAEWASERGRPAGSLLQREKDAILNARAGARAAATRAPERGPSTEMTAAQRTSNERWRSTQLRTLEREYRNSQGDDVPMSLEDFRAAQREIEDTYRSGGNLPPLPDEPTPRRVGADADPVAPVDGPSNFPVGPQRTGDIALGRGTAPPPASGARAAAPRPVAPAAPIGVGTAGGAPATAAPPDANQPVRVTLPNGQTKVFPNQQAFEAFKRRYGLR